MGAPRARHGVYDLDLFAVVAYDPMAAEHPAVHAGVGALEAGVMRLYASGTNLLVSGPGCVRTAGAIFVPVDTVSAILFYVKLCCIISG